jgi:hypothetical protein
VRSSWANLIPSNKTEGTCMDLSLIDFNDLSPSMKARRFHEENGAECYRASPGSSVFYYPTGAVMENGGSPELCVFHFPPDPASIDGEHKLMFRKLRFAKLKLDRAVTAFDELNTHLANGLPCDEDGELAKLKALAMKVEERKQLVAEAQEAFNNTRAEKGLAEQRRAKEEELQRITDWQHKRRSVRV